MESLYVNVAIMSDNPIPANDSSLKTMIDSLDKMRTATGDLASFSYTRTSPDNYSMVVSGSGRAWNAAIVFDPGLFPTNPTLSVSMTGVWRNGEANDIHALMTPIITMTNVYGIESFAVDWDAP